MDKILYLDTSEPFNGYVTDISYDGGKTLHYSKMSPEVWSAENGGNLVRIPQDAYEKHLKRYLDARCTQPEAISEKDFDYFLEVLPPCKWATVNGVNMFHISERLTFNLVEWFARYQGQHFRFTNYDDADRSKLAEQVKAHAGQSEAP